jgi:hypothetical protein
VLETAVNGHVAAKDLRWCGRKVAQAFAAYISPGGSKSIRPTLEALARHHERDFEDLLLRVWCDPIDDANAVLAGIEAQAKTLGPCQLVVIDHDHGQWNWPAVTYLAVKLQSDVARLRVQWSTC